MSEINAPAMDGEHLYRRISVTDGKVGFITECIPVKLIDGRLVDNPEPKHLFEGQTFLNGQPFTFKIEADSLLEAINNFSPTIVKAVEEMQRAQRLAQIANPVPPGMVGKIVPPGRR